MNATDDASMGLRERSKARRRRSILHTALRLFAEHGYDGTTIQDIAAAADVAPRTVTGYFPSKLDLVIEWPAIRTKRMIAIFEADPSIDFIELVDRWWAEARQTVDPEEAALTRTMSLANPGIVAMAEAEVTRRVAAHGLVPGDLVEPPSDDLDQVAGRAAIAGINRVFFQGIAEGRMNDARHASLLDLIRIVATATNLGHGALDPRP